MTEELLTLQQAAKLIPSKPDQSTVWRWAVRGVDGIFLDSVKFGRRIFTSQAAIEDFSRKLAEAHRENHASRNGKGEEPCRY